MGAWFDESRLDDPAVLTTWDTVLRPLAESGARVRREMAGAAEVLPAAVAAALVGSRPRAVVAAGPDSRLLRAVLEPWCPVPFVAWPGAGLPGWVGSLDLVVVLAPEGSDHGSASAVSEAVRRGAQAVVACPPRSLVAEHAAGRWTTLFPMATGDQLASAVVMLEYLDQVQLGPRTDAEEVAGALDAVATSCSPHRDLAVNDAKMLAIALADTMPVVWGGSVLAARAARRVAESLRRATGTSAIAGVAENLLPVLEATRPRDVFDDPFADEGGERRPLLLVLDDGTEQELARAERDQLLQAASLRGIRTETVSCRDGLATEVARYASLVLHGRYAAAYLQCGLVQD